MLATWGGADEPAQGVSFGTMRVFNCDHCGHLVFFDSVQCLHCGSTLAFVPDQLSMAALTPAPQDGPDLWRRMGERGGSAHSGKLYRTTGEARYQEGMRHALTFLRTAFLDPVDRAMGGYAWLIDWHEGRATVQDATRHCYGMAFVMLAYARVFEAGVPEARQWLAEAFDTTEQHFWQPAAGLYADEANTAWQITNYRGQNANMHACEAMISAFRATGERRYIERAEQLAQGICQRQAALSTAASAPAAEGWVWEHFHADWSVDWDYNRHDRSNIFRPWGYQVGHQTEWAKLLLQLDALLPADWHLPCAQRLFDAAVERGWDAEHGGIYYGMAPDGSICDDGKYHWAQAVS
eukprot:gene45097-56147_t